MPFSPISSHARCELLSIYNPVSFLLTQFLLLDEEGRHKSQCHRQGLEPKHSHGGCLVAAADDASRAGRQLGDVVEALAHALLDLTRVLPAAELRRELGPEDLLQDGRGDADANGGTQGPEEVAAGDDDRCVLLGGVGDECHQACGDACVVEVWSVVMFAYVKTEDRDGEGDRK